MHPDIIHRPGVISEAACAAWVRGVYEARASWTPCFDGVQFTVGRAWYTHLEERREAAYFESTTNFDALVERYLPGLQGRILAIASELVGGPVQRRPGWCGPGVHVFPAGEWLAQNGGEIHFDTDGLRAAELANRPPAVSVIVMLQPASSGGGLRVWDAFHGEHDEDEEPQVPSVTLEYGTGDVIAIDSYRLHQIQPFGGRCDRISATAHLMYVRGRWQCWF